MHRPSTAPRNNIITLKLIKELLIILNNKRPVQNLPFSSISLKKKALEMNDKLTCNSLSLYSDSKQI
jgi:hypothetical protein